MITYFLELIFVNLLTGLVVLIGGTLNFVISTPSTALSSALSTVAPNLGILDAVFPISTFITAMVTFLEILAGIMIFKLVKFLIPGK